MRFERAIYFVTGCGLGLDLSLPLADLNWMDAVLLGDLVDGPLGLELRRMNSHFFDSVIVIPFL